MVVLEQCANCGKGEDNNENLKTCTACMSVKYCNRQCQSAHRKQHKKECKKRAAALFDETLFKTPPPREDCPICFLQLPSEAGLKTYQPCCGQILCVGCMFEMSSLLNTCPFCRKFASSTNEEWDARLIKRVNAGDVNAIYNQGSKYFQGKDGFPKDIKKALEYYERAVQIDPNYFEAHYNLSEVYSNGEQYGIETDSKKGLHHRQQAAMPGCLSSRYSLGCDEYKKGDIARAQKHFLISARGGCKNSLHNVGLGFRSGHVSKDEYEKTIRDHHSHIDEVKSKERVKGAAHFHDELYCEQLRW